MVEGYEDLYLEDTKYLLLAEEVFKDIANSRTSKDYKH